MSVAPFRLAGRDDESLYSTMARWIGYLGDPPAAHVVPAVFGSSLAIYDDLPVGMSRLEHGGWLDGTARDVVPRSTAYSYYSAFASETRRDAGMKAMLGDGPWPHGELGSWRVEAMPPDRLRFCRACMAEMLAHHPDPWWRVLHQLPTVLMCPDHGEVLVDSVVGRRSRRRRYVPATLAVCAADGASAFDGPTTKVRELLAWMATHSRDLLAEGVGVDVLRVRSDYRRILSDRGVRYATARDLELLAVNVVSFWRPVLDGRPDWNVALCNGRWLTVVLGSGQAPPLHHLLLQGFLELG